MKKSSHKMKKDPFLLQILEYDQVFEQRVVLVSNMPSCTPAFCLMQIVIRKTKYFSLFLFLSTAVSKGSAGREHLKVKFHVILVKIYLQMAIIDKVM